MATENKLKILLVRFSSIGDIVLTTPVVRSLRRAMPQAELHFLTKKAFHSILEFNPYLDKVHRMDPEAGLSGLMPQLKAEKYDCMLDLHRNLRTHRLALSLGVKRHTFPKLNKEKYLLTRFGINRMPDLHIVDRYAEVLKPLGLSLDGNGLDFFCGEKAAERGRMLLRENLGELKPVGVVLGGLHATKRWPVEYYAPLLNRLKQPVVLLGGPAEKEDADKIEAGLKVPCLNAAGRYDLLTSAALLRGCAYSIANDTGFMHISAAFGLPTVSIWGNTVPEFGMYPYKTEKLIIEEKGLKCRPCSKLGHPACPKGHFKCMRNLSPERVYDEIVAFRS